MSGAAMLLLSVLLHLLVQVRALGEHCRVFKRVLRESDKWEVARAPNEVSYNLNSFTTACCCSNAPDSPLGFDSDMPGAALGLCRAC